MNRPHVITLPYLLLCLAGALHASTDTKQATENQAPTIYLNATLLAFTADGTMELQRLSPAPEGTGHFIALNRSSNEPLGLDASQTQQTTESLTLTMPSGGEGTLRAGEWLHVNSMGQRTPSGTDTSEFTGITLSVTCWADASGKIIVDAQLTTSTFEGFVEIAELTSEGAEALRFIPAMSARSVRETLSLASGQTRPFGHPELLSQKGYQHRMLLLSASTDAKLLKSAHYEQMLREWCANM